MDELQSTFCNLKSSIRNLLCVPQCPPWLINFAGISHDLKELCHNLAHLSLGAVRDFYEQAYRDCRLIYSRLPSPRQMQTLVQVWKQLRKWR